MNSEKIGDFIKKIRIDKNMTQDDLAKKINVTNKAVSRWERGIGFPDISLLVPLSNELDVSVLELLNGEYSEKKRIKEKSNDIAILIDYFNEIKEVYDFRKIIFITIVFLFVCVMIFLTYFNYRFHGFDIIDFKMIFERINLIPFLNIYSIMTSSSIFVFFKNILINIILSFIICTYLVQFLKNRKRYTKTIIIINIVIEIVKLITFLGMFDINDVLIRIIIGMFIYNIYKHRREVKK